jgi:hypothetical protein
VRRETSAPTAFISDAAARPAGVSASSTRRASRASGDWRTKPRAIRRPTTPETVAGSMRVNLPSWFCDTDPKSSSLASAANCVGVTAKLSITALKISLARWCAQRSRNPTWSSSAYAAARSAASAPASSTGLRRTLAMVIRATP